MARRRLVSAIAIILSIVMIVGGYVNITVVDPHPYGQMGRIWFGYGIFILGWVILFIRARLL